MPDYLSVDLLGESEGITSGAVGTDVPQPVASRCRATVVLFQEIWIRPEAACRDDDGMGPHLVGSRSHSDNSARVDEESIHSFAQRDVDAPAAAMGFQHVDDAGTEGFRYMVARDRFIS